MRVSARYVQAPFRSGFFGLNLRVLCVQRKPAWVLNDLVRQVDIQFRPVVVTEGGFFDIGDGFDGLVFKLV